MRVHDSPHSIKHQLGANRAFVLLHTLSGPLRLCAAILYLRSVIWRKGKGMRFTSKHFSPWSFDSISQESMPPRYLGKRQSDLSSTHKVGTLRPPTFFLNLRADYRQQQENKHNFVIKIDVARPNNVVMCDNLPRGKNMLEHDSPHSNKHWLGCNRAFVFLHTLSGPLRLCAVILSQTSD